jgi:integrase
MTGLVIADLQLFKPKGDARWAYRFRVPDGLPGPRRPMGRGYATRRDAQAAAQARIDALLAQARDAAIFPTVSELIADYRVLRPGKGGGRERVAWALGKIEARFGAIRIDQITAREVEVWIAGLGTPSTRWEVSRVFRQLFAQAGHHYNVKNPVRVSPQPRRAEVKPFKDLAELERVAIELGEWGDAARFVAATGMRPEEWIPLEPSDVDEQAQTVTVRRTYTEGKGLDQFAGKTAGSIRTIPLSAAALAAYQVHRRRRPDSTLIFPAGRGGYLNLRNWRDRDWHPALEAAGVEPRGPNALRHTFATWFLLHSDDRWLLAKLMGTSVDMIEQHYGHLLPPHATRSRDILDAIWDGFGRNLDATRSAANEPEPPVPLNHARNSKAL